MIIEDIKQHLGKPTTKLSLGGVHPTHELTECWIGKVFLFGQGETLPRDDLGNEMMPLAQICLKNLPYIPEAVAGIELITLFVSTEFPQPFDEMGSSWLIREYKSVQGLERKEFVCPDLEPFPLHPEMIERDCPLWEDQILSSMKNDMPVMENSGEIECYYDTIDHYYAHKFGGYPSYCQSGIDFGDGYEFVFQIASDPNVRLTIGDEGSLMFARNRSDGRWVIYCDEY